MSALAPALASAVPEYGGGLRERKTLDDAFVLVLAFLLLGYAFLGKGFAYTGIPPFYVGELVLIAGLFVLFRTDCLIASTASVASVLLFILMGVVAARTGYDLSRYGVDALRDSVVVLYGVYAFIAAALLIAKPPRIDDIIRYYRMFAAAYVIAPLLTMLFGSAVQGYLPSWPNSGLPLVSLRAGELGVHLAGVAAFTLLGFRRQGWLWSLMLIIGVAIVGAQSRGAMLAFAIPTAIAAIFAINKRRFMQLAILAVFLGAFAVAANVDIRIDGSKNPQFDQRNLQFDQIAANVTSIFGDSSTGNLSGTKEWRLEWWKTIVHYTFDGDYFWFGKGYGPNLAQVDGFVVGPGTPPLRSPHSVHMTLLARSGVPGLVLWLLMLLVWFGTLFRNAVVARRDGETVWAQFFVFIACYALAALIDASFDVAIEGPMVGIWFWVLIGIGLGSSMVYWSRYPGRSALRLPSGTLMPALSVAAALLAFMPVSAWSHEAPQQAKALQQLANRKGTCLVIRNRSDVIIENLRIGPCAEHGIEVIASRNVVIRNVSISHTGKIGIRVLSSEDIDIRGNVVFDTLSSVFVQASRRVKVGCNHLRNPRGPIPRGQFVQFDDVHGPGNSISCNIGRNEPGRGQPEDAISIYRSSGSPGSPILVEKNTIIGGGPSLSGGGIMLGDGGGAYLAARGNILEDPGQYGIGVAGDHDIEVTGNVVVARRQPFTNVGISVWRQHPPACRNITVKDNVVHWISKYGRPNPWWKGEHYCDAVAGLRTNNFAATPADIERRKAQLHCGC